jgi:cobalt-zinc-cadmium efflux system outer membrane protein
MNQLNNLFGRSILVPVILITISSVPLSVSAQVNAGDITLADASSRTLTYNPELKSYAFSVRAAEAQRIQAGLRPNPELGLQLENIAGTGDLRGLRSLETTLAISQVIELGDKRNKRIDRAMMDIGLVESDYEVKRLDVIAELARRFVHVVKSQLLLQVAENRLQQTVRSRDAVAVRVAAARAMRTELAKAEIAVSRAEIALEHQEHELESTKRMLAASWGEDKVDFNHAAADLFSLPPVNDIEQLLNALKTSPDLQRFVNVRRMREAELALASTRAIPDAQIGAGIRRLEALDDQALMLTFSIGLPLNDRNQGNIQAARERMEQVETSEQASYIEAQSLLFGTYQELLHSATESNKLITTLIPAAEQIVADYEKAYQTGRLSYLELAQAQNEFIQLQSDSIHAAANYHLFLIEIERLTGTSLLAHGGEK